MAENGVPKNDPAGNREELEAAFYSLSDALSFVRNDAKAISVLSAVSKSNADSFVIADAIEALEHISCYLHGHITDLEMSVEAVQNLAYGEGRK